MSNIAPLNLTVSQLTDLLEENPSLRGMCMGYAVEYHVREQLLQEDVVNSVNKQRDHDRESKYDFLVDTIAGDIRIEVKMLRPNDIVRMSKSYSSVTHPEGIEEVIDTFDILKSTFDVLAVVNPTTFEAYYILSSDLPDSTARTVPEEYRHMFCKTAFPLASVTAYRSLTELLESGEDMQCMQHLPHGPLESPVQTSIVQLLG